MMAQNRQPPAFQEYPGAMLTSLAFRLMHLQDRGLLYTMRLECWVNVRLPADPRDLATVLGLSVAEVELSLPVVMDFFALEGDSIVSPELEAYRAHLEDRKTKQSQGGKTGAAITNTKRTPAKKRKNAGVSATPAGDSAATPAGDSAASGRVLSTVQPNPEQQNPTQPIEKLQHHPLVRKGKDQSFVQEDESTEAAAAAYRKASGG